MGDLKWSPETVEYIKRLADEGYSAGEAAEKIGGGTTRSMLISLSHRRGFKFHKTIAIGGGGRKPAPARPKIAKAKVSRVKPRSMPPKPKPKPYVPPAIIVPHEPVRLIDAKPFTCRYVVGEPDGENTIFCGGPVHGETFWFCQDHKHICTAPPTTRLR